MSQLSVILQESGEREVKTILGLLSDQMEASIDQERRRRRIFRIRERLGLRGLGCCGATWGFRPSATSAGDDQPQRRGEESSQNANVSEILIMDPGCLAPNPVRPALNLAAALAAERQFREVNESTTNNFTMGRTPLRVSLMRLLEEAAEAGGDGRTSSGMGEERGGADTVCCVCMVRKKGAAFIPCGHTYCRACCRELWLNRGSCPLCNRSILDILHIF